MFTHVLVAVDGSVHAQNAVECGAAIAGRFDAALTLLHAVADFDTSRVPDWMKEYSQVEHVRLTETDVLTSLGSEILGRAVEVAKAKGAGRVESVAEVGSPAKVICAYADSHDVDLIVMGRRGLGDAAGVLLGSVSHQVAHLSTCACMTVV